MSLFLIESVECIPDGLENPNGLMLMCNANK